MNASHALSFPALPCAALVLGAMLAVSGEALAGQATLEPATLAIVPQPVAVTPRAGHFTVTRHTVIWTDRASAEIGDRLARYLEPATGWTLRVQTGGTPPAGAIVLRRDATLKNVGTEGYSLDVRPGRILARAQDGAGLFYAVQTLRQLLPPEIFRDAPVGAIDWTRTRGQYRRLATLPLARRTPRRRRATSCRRSS